MLQVKELGVLQGFQCRTTMIKERRKGMKLKALFSNEQHMFDMPYRAQHTMVHVGGLHKHQVDQKLEMRAEMY